MSGPSYKSRLTSPGALSRFPPPPRRRGIGPHPPPIPGTGRAPPMAAPILDDLNAPAERPPMRSAGASSRRGPDIRSIRAASATTPGKTSRFSTGLSPRPLWVRLPYDQAPVPPRLQRNGFSPYPGSCSRGRPSHACSNDRLVPQQKRTASFQAAGIPRLAPPPPPPPSSILSHTRSPPWPPAPDQLLTALNMPDPHVAQYSLKRLHPPADISVRP